ncbi:MAG: hypothetical protein F2697_07235, partial [Actinobacteria bacterium]|nr:hypothetical protein [Actinomycetota bacterium]
MAAVAAGTVAIALMATPAAGTLGTVTPRASDSGTASGSASAAATSTATAVSTATATPTATSDPSATATATPSPTVTTPTPDATATATPSAEPVPAPPPPLPTELGSWCTTLFPPQRTSIEREKAQAIMGGKATMSQGGTYRITEHPNWKPQSSTDTSGD